MSILVDRCFKRSELVQELFAEMAEESPLDNGDAQFARDLAELCGECLDLIELCKHAWTGLRGGLEKVRNTQAAGRTFQSALRKSHHVVNGVIELCETSDKKGLRVSDHSRLAAKIPDLIEVIASAQRDWPFFRMDRMEEARTAFRQGDFRSAEDLLHDAQDNRSGANHP